MVTLIRQDTGQSLAKTEQRVSEMLHWRTLLKMNGGYYYKYALNYDDNIQTHHLVVSSCFYAELCQKEITISVFLYIFKALG